MIKLTIEDLQEIADFKVIEKPLIQKPLIAEADVVTIDNNLSTYVTGTQKRELTVNLGYMDREGYEVLRGFRDRQYENLKYPKATITSDVEIAPDGQIVEGETTKSFNFTTSDNKLDVKSIELAKIGTNEDYVFKDGGKYYVHKAIGKIAGYDGETITTSYISTTGALTTGATVYYVLSTPEEYEIAKGTLIELKYAKTYAGETTIWSEASEGSLPTKLDYTYSKAGYLQPVQITDSTYEHLASTLDASVDITKLGGDTYQANYTGKNLVNLNAFVKGRVDSGTIGYATGTDSITVSGDKITFVTNTAFRGVVSELIAVQPSSRVTFSGISTDSNTRLYMDMYTSSNTWISKSTINDVYPSGWPCSATVASNCAYVRISFQKATAGTVTLSNLQLEEGSTATTYEPYVGGTASPNPDYPQDVVVVTGTQKVKVNNKNLAKQENGTANFSWAGQTWTFINGSIITTRTNLDAQGGAVDITNRNAATWASSTGSDHVLTKNGGDYTISFSRVGSFTPKEGASNYLSYIYVNTYNNSGNVRTIEALNLISSASNRFTITLAEDEHIGSIVHYSQYVAFENLELKIQLEEGSTATSFVPYQSQECTLELAKDYFDISTFGMGGMNSGHLYELNYRITNIENPLEIKPSTQYTISVKLGGSVKGFRLGVHQLDKNKNFLSDSNWQNVYRNPYTFTTRSDAKYIGIVCSLSTTSTNVTTGGTESQVAYTSPSEWLRGCEVHIHEPASDIELCRIGDYQDYFYKSGSKWWLHKETGRYTFNDASIMTWTTKTSDRRK